MGVGPISAFVHLKQQAVPGIMDTEYIFVEGMNKGILCQVQRQEERAWLVPGTERSWLRNGKRRRGILKGTLYQFKSGLYDCGKPLKSLGAGG